MPLFFITGLPGTGKSTVNAELKTRGYESYDGDEDHLAYWFDTAGNPVPHKDEKRTPEFLQAHTRDIARTTIEQLSAKAQDKTVFLCADPDNEAALQDLFAQAYVLVLDEATRQHRLATRTNNSWGKLPHELAYDLASQQNAPQRYKKYGYISLDASQSPKAIVDMLLEQLKVVQ